MNATKSIAAWLAALFVPAIILAGAASDHVTMPPLKKWLFTGVALVLTVALLQWFWREYHRWVILWLCVAWLFVLAMWYWN